MVLLRNLDLRNRILSIRDEDSGARNSEFKSPLPTPKYFSGEQTFSSKKDKVSQKRSPSPPPLKLLGKSCPPPSRLFSRRDCFNPDRAQCISFTESNTSLSKFYDENVKTSYFEQCFETIRKLGSGSFGEVFKVRCKEDGKYYAIKRSKQKFQGKADRERKLQEVAKHEKLPRNPNCVYFYKAWEEKQILYIQTELCHISLSQYSEINHDIPEKIIWNFLVDLLLAAKHLHDHNLVHLDIKPANIFISHEGICKLGDFGLVVDLSNLNTSDVIEGDPKYLAPEVMQGIFTKAADVFSIGITILELASDLDLPRCDEAWHQLRKLEIPSEFLQKLSPELSKVIMLMMEPNHEKRPTIDDVLQLDSVNKVYQERISLLTASLSNGNLLKSDLEGFLNNQQWNYSIEDDVFEEQDNDDINNSSNLSSGIKRSNMFFISEDSLCEEENSSINNSRSSHMSLSTPANFRYWDTSLLSTSASPLLPKSVNLGVTPSRSISPLASNHSNKKQLFTSSPTESDLGTIAASIEPKNLLDVFNNISSEESP